jgi:hypothetical protein
MSTATPVSALDRGSPDGQTAAARAAPITSVAAVAGLRLFGGLRPSLVDDGPR